MIHLFKKIYITLEGSLIRRDRIFMADADHVHKYHPFDPGIAIPVDKVDMEYLTYLGTNDELLDSDIFKIIDSVKDLDGVTIIQVSLDNYLKILLAWTWAVFPKASVQTIVFIVKLHYFLTGCDNANGSLSVLPTHRVKLKSAIRSIELDRPILADKLEKYVLAHPSDISIEYLLVKYISKAIPEVPIHKLKRVVESSYNFREYRKYLEVGLLSNSLQEVFGYSGKEIIDNFEDISSIPGLKIINSEKMKSFEGRGYKVEISDVIDDIFSIIKLSGNLERTNSLSDEKTFKEVINGNYKIKATDGRSQLIDSIIASTSICFSKSTLTNSQKSNLYLYLIYNYMPMVSDIVEYSDSRIMNIPLVSWALNLDSDKVKELR